MEYSIEEDSAFVCTKDARGYFAIESTGELVTQCDSEYQNSTHCQLPACPYFYVRNNSKFCVEQCDDENKYSLLLETG